jgi:hypothetical protein
MMNNDDDDLDELPARPRQVIEVADRELLELAGRALGAVGVEDVDGEAWVNLHFADGTVAHGWNPLLFYGDTFELAADLGLQVYPVARTAHGAACSAVGDSCGRRLSEVTATTGVRAATARAVVLAAAEVGKDL